MTLTVYHLGLSQSDRVLWLCEELGLDYELKKFDRVPETHLAPPELLEQSPTGTAPVITDTYRGKPVVISESGAILEYLDTVYGDKRFSVKPDEDGYVDFLFWFHFMGTSLTGNVFMQLVAGRLADTEEKRANDPILSRLPNYLTLMEERLTDVPYLAGEKLTIADILGFFALTTGRLFVKIDLSPYPHIQQYLKRVGSRPAYQKALQVGDPGLKPPLE